MHFIKYRKKLWPALNYSLYHYKSVMLRDAERLYVCPNYGTSTLGMLRASSVLEEEAPTEA